METIDFQNLVNVKKIQNKISGKPLCFVRINNLVCIGSKNEIMVFELKKNSLKEKGELRLHKFVLTLT
jgi:hypothetical protein